MPHVICNDEYGRTWIAQEGDPAWEAAKQAKTKLLLPQPTLPLKLILTGWPDLEIHKVRQEMADYLEVKERIGAEKLQRVWENLSRRFRAWRTQLEIYGGREIAVQTEMFSEEHADL